MIYAIQCGAGGPVKLGRAKDAKGRLGELQVSHWLELTLVASEETEDDVSAERLLHERCAKDRIRGEWFRPTCAVLEVVREMREKRAAQSSLQRQAAEIVAGYRAHMRKYRLIRLYAVLKRLFDGKPVHQI